MFDHTVIVHAFTSDELGDHYLDDYPVDAGVEVKWTAYERIIRDESEPHESPWEIDEGSYEDIVAAATTRAAEVGAKLRIEHDPEDIYA